LRKKKGRPGGVWARDNISWKNSWAEKKKNRTETTHDGEGNRVKVSKKGERTRERCGILHVQQDRR